MKVLICLAGFLVLASGQGTTPCAQCLQPIWYMAVAENLGNVTDRCSEISLEGILTCIDTCDQTPADKPLSYRIRQLTQISDVFHSLLANNCPIHAGNSSANSSASTSGGDCLPMINCLLSQANYDFEGSTGHATYSTVFDYKCGPVARNSVQMCLNTTGTNCVSAERLTKLRSILSLGVEAACDEPRRCVKYGNIFEVKPGTNCKQYYKEASAYGPSIDNANAAAAGQAFNPAICNFEFEGDFSCPADPAVTQIYSEIPPTKPTTQLPADTQTVQYEPVQVNTSLPCEQCLYPVWYRAVTTSGPHLCDPSFQSLVYECLATCKCCPGCAPCAGRYEQLKTEVLVKLADISNALEMSQCSGNPSCTSESYTCTKNIARFFPKSAPHDTVNKFSCSPTHLNAAIECFQRSCNDTAVATSLTSTVIAGYDPVCMSDERCMSYGSIFEYVPITEVTEPDAVPCMHYRQAPANGWSQPPNVKKVDPTFLFNMEGCYSDFASNVQCPAQISSAMPF